MRFQGFSEHEKQRQAAMRPHGVKLLDPGFVQNLLVGQHNVNVQEAALKALMYGKVEGGFDRKRDTKADSKAEKASSAAAAKAGQAEQLGRQQEAENEEAEVVIADDADLVVTNKMTF